jgi:hypothetical protein
MKNASGAHFAPGPGDAVADGDGVAAATVVTFAATKESMLDSDAPSASIKYESAARYRPNAGAVAATFALKAAAAALRDAASAQHVAAASSARETDAASDVRTAK